MAELSIDIETFSDISINLGVYKYVDSPNFTVLLFGYAVNDGPAHVVDFKNGGTLPKDIEDMLFDDSVVKTAFNAQFERVCLNKFLGRDTKNWECSMIKAWYCGLTGSLERVGFGIGLAEDEQKLKDGKRLIKKFCIPNKKTQIDLLDDEDWELFKDYCKRDVEVEVTLRKKLNRFALPDWERRLYKLDQEINDNGIKLDLDMVNNAIQIDADMVGVVTKRYKELTGLDNPKSVVDIKNFIKEKTGKSVKSITKNNEDELVKEFANYPDILKVLDIRKLVSKTSTAKYHTMRDVILSDGRSRGNIQHYGASRTGRWAGRLIQVHNLPQNHIDDLDTARELVKTSDYEFLSLCYDNPPDILSQCIRAAIIPEEGKKFIVADFSAIEARVIAWFAGEDWVLDVFRTTGKIYEAAASRMFNVPLEQITKGSDLRQKGKVATLALGYQGGKGSLEQMGAVKMGIAREDLQDIVDKWRKANSNIVSLWYETDKAVKKAIRDGESVVFANGKLKAYCLSGILWIELPSGRCLAYAKPKIVPHEKWPESDKVEFKELHSTTNTWRTEDTYGGKLVENIVQATARDCLAFSMLKLADAGYKIVMHVHDEVVIEIDKDSKDLNKICSIMGEELEWAKGLPLKADGYECDYYKKD